jgi:(2R)-sulfolactate sulfo-lyase subunit alpha
MPTPPTSTNPPIFLPHNTIEGLASSPFTFYPKKGVNEMIQFLVHEKADNVGVATVDIPAGETAKGLFMDTQEAIEMKAAQEIPLGHKIALKNFKVDEPVIKYGHDIGRVVAAIGTGEHVHIHNLKTRRW